MACPPGLLLVLLGRTKRRRKCLLAGVLLTVALLMLVVLRRTWRLGTEESPVFKQVPRFRVALSKDKAILEEPQMKASKSEIKEQLIEEENHRHYILEGIEEKPIDPHFHRGHGLPQASNSSCNCSRGCQDWVNRAPKPPFFLTAVLLVRIYAADKAKLTSKELKMWLQYLRYAGVEHVYVYDAWVHESESQLNTLRAFAEDGYVTYTDWHTHNPYTIGGTQVASYQHCIDNFKEENQWQAAIDIDEYPFSPKDTSPGFLYRYIKDYSTYHPQISEITMQNFLFLGKPQPKELMIERLMRRTPKPANPLVKPIYISKNVRAGVHHNSLRKGRSINAPSGELRMNHYWGARLQNWGEDTPEILGKTIPDDSMQPITDAFKACESQVRPYL